jgi:hypothetical protein
MGAPAASGRLAADCPSVLNVSAGAPRIVDLLARSDRATFAAIRIGGASTGRGRFESLRVAVAGRIRRSRCRLETGDGPADQGEEPKRQQSRRRFRRFRRRTLRAATAMASQRGLNPCHPIPPLQRTKNASAAIVLQQRHRRMAFSGMGDETPEKARNPLHDGVADTLVSFVRQPAAAMDS